MLQNKVDNFLLEENLKKLDNYLKTFFNNLYNCCIKGLGYDITKFQKKTVYRLKNNVQELGFILKEENSNTVKIFFLEKNV